MDWLSANSDTSLTPDLAEGDQLAVEPLGPVSVQRLDDAIARSTDEPAKPKRRSLSDNTSVDTDVFRLSDLDVEQCDRRLKRVET